MLLGVQIKNFDVFADNDCGILIDEFIAYNKEFTEGSKQDGLPESDKGQKKRKSMLTGLYPLRNLSAFIGKNGTGKTSFLEALYFLKHSVTKNVADASITNDRPGFSKMIIDKDKPCEFKLFFKLSDNKNPLFIQYELSIASTVHGSPYIFAEQARVCNDRCEEICVLKFNEGKGTVLRDIGAEQEEGELNSKHQTALKSYSGIKAYKLISMLYKEIDGWFFCRFSSENRNTYFEDGNAPGGHKHLDSTGSNVKNVLEYLRVDDTEKYNEIVSMLETKSMAFKKKKKLPSKLDSSPDKYLLYLLLLNEKSLHSTIFIETPDRDLYFDMVDSLAEEFREYTINHSYNQIILTTHNSRIVESMPPKEIWMFRRIDKEDIDDIEIKSFGKDKLVDAMFKEGIGMGAIWYSGYLDSDENNEESTEENTDENAEIDR